MAGRILNRRELRKQSDVAGQPGTSASGPSDAVSPPEAAGGRKAAAPRVRKPRKPKVLPRKRALWCVFDGGMKEVALFDYNQRAAAETKLAAMLDRQKGTYFLQLVKHPIPAAEPAPVAATA